MRFILAKLYGLLRLLTATAIVYAVSVQFHTSVLRHDADPVNFFSYFTILSNIFIAVIFLVSATGLFRDKKPGLALECSRGAATLYMTTTGIIYAMLLSQYDLGLTLPWVNFVLHQFVPVLAILDWMIAPPERRLSFRIWWSWLSFPLLYVIYTLIRGPIAHWYPYPFLDPNEPGGYGRVFVYCLGITIGMSLLVLLIGWAGNFLRLKMGPKSARPTKNSSKRKK